MNEFDLIIAYEQGELSENDIIELFQSLVNSGAAWKLQGHYGRTAEAMIKAGYINPPPSKESEESHA